ncbi:hypothetical protein BJ322DRAFT_1023545 [Thelephora terrestris]|uniref:Uncharacterized protein n=1 Tax=Thelephora terrestris TaxID=56493 RepID=A0A9P6HA00_9AGAM|nr:hypothetical protein BJ322DRAFT_1023545 [Thelephora terrestris]
MHGRTRTRGVEVDGPRNSRTAGDNTKTDRFYTSWKAPTPCSYASPILFVWPSYRTLEETKRHDVVLGARGLFLRDWVEWEESASVYKTTPLKLSYSTRKTVAAYNGQSSVETERRQLGYPPCVRPLNQPWPLATTRWRTCWYNLYQSSDQSHKHPRQRVDQAAKSNDPLHPTRRKRVTKAARKLLQREERCIRPDRKGADLRSYLRNWVVHTSWYTCCEECNLLMVQVKNSIVFSTVVLLNENRNHRGRTNRSIFTGIGATDDHVQQCVRGAGPCGTEDMLKFSHSVESKNALLAASWLSRGVSWDLSIKMVRRVGIEDGRRDESYVEVIPGATFLQVTSLHKDIIAVELSRKEKVVARFAKFRTCISARRELEESTTAG